MRKEIFWEKIWNIFWPLTIYVIAQNVFMLILNQAMISVLTAALICIPFYYRMYQRDWVQAGEEKRNIPMENKDVPAIILSGAALALAMNNIIAITPLPYFFTGYQKTNEVIYSSSMILQVLGAGILGCIVEEVSMRGVVYLRMKRYWGKRNAMIFSALVFGMYHLNLVQGVYAFCLGLFFAWLYDRYKTLWAPIIAHMSANLFILLLAASKIYGNVVNTLVGFSLVTCISLLVFYYGWRWIKQTDPVIPLEFVEKEPDTLERLTEEYKEQGTEEEKR